jgi:hypothetical protein
MIDLLAQLGGRMQRARLLVCFLFACGGGGNGGDDAPPGGDGGGVDGPPPNGVSPEIGGCSILPPDHIFNTPIGDLPSVHADSDTWVALIGNNTRLHLDLGTQTDQTQDDFYGIPYNLVNGNSMTWPEVDFTSPDPDFDWDPTVESDCANAQKGVVSPCTANTAYLPFTNDALVEGGLSTAANHLPYGDHHLIALDVDTCRLWEAYHVYRPNNRWEIFGSATFDLASNDLRVAGWTSADAAGFPILPLLLRPEEAATGEIKHALRFTMTSGNIRGEYTWPATHEASNNMSAGAPPMGQLFRLKASFTIPNDWSTQSKAIAQAMKTYGMYVADGGSNWYVTGAPGAWDDSVFDEIQSIQGMNFEAVDLRPIIQRAGFDPTSARVPPP